MDHPHIFYLIWSFVILVNNLIFLLSYRIENTFCFTIQVMEEWLAGSMIVCWVESTHNIYSPSPTFEWECAFRKQTIDCLRPPSRSRVIFGVTCTKFYSYLVFPLIFNVCFNKKDQLHSGFFKTLDNRNFYFLCK